MKSVVPQIAVYGIRTIWRRGSFILDTIEYQSAFAISLRFEMPQVIKESWYIPSIRCTKLGGPLIRRSLQKRRWINQSRH
jgi:hypothetical protein